MKESLLFKLDEFIYILLILNATGQEDYDRLRPLSYPNTHVILLCFAIDSPDSLDNVQEKVSWLQIQRGVVANNRGLQWINELYTHIPNVPFILVGCKKDLRDDEKTVEELRQIGQKPVSYEEVCEMGLYQFKAETNALLLCLVLIGSSGCRSHQSWEIHGMLCQTRSRCAGNIYFGGKAGKQP